jgi:hypothetical protein
MTMTGTLFPAVRCPFCREELSAPDEPARECRLCGTLLHEACATAHGRCTTLACPGELREPTMRIGRRALRVAPPPPSSIELLGAELARLPLRAWALAGMLVTAGLLIAR